MGPILVLLTFMQNMTPLQRIGFGNSITFLNGSQLSKYPMGLGQGSREAPVSWIQFSAVIVNVLKRLEFGAMIVDPITRNVIHTAGSMFVDDTHLYC